MSSPNGPRLGSKSGSVRVSLSRALAMGEKVTFGASLADVESAQVLFVLYRATLDSTSFDERNALINEITVQKTREHWSIAYSESGFAKVLFEYVDGPEDVQVEATFAAYLFSDDRAIVSGATGLAVGERTSWVFGK